MVRSRRLWVCRGEASHRDRFAVPRPYIPPVTRLQVCMLTSDGVPCMLSVSYLSFSIDSGGDNFKERTVPESRQLAEQFMAALAANDAAQYAALLDEQVGLRVWHWRGQDVRRPRERVLARLMEEWSAWPDASLETFGIV